MKTCPVCEGDGYTQDEGTGIIDYSGPVAPEYSECETCHGTGFVPETPEATAPIAAIAEIVANFWPSYDASLLAALDAVNAWLVDKPEAEPYRYGSALIPVTRRVDEL